MVDQPTLTPEIVGASSHTIEMGDVWEGWQGQWIKIKPYLSYAQQVTIEAKQVKTTIQSTTTKGASEVAQAQVEASAVESMALLCEVAVVEWNLQGYDGTVLPVGRLGVISPLAPFDLLDQAYGEIRDYYDSQRPPDFRERAKSD